MGLINSFDGFIILRLFFTVYKNKDTEKYYMCDTKRLNSKENEKYLPLFALGRVP